MNATIERLSFGGILDRSFQLLKAAFVPLVALFSLVQLPSVLVGQIFEQPENIAEMFSIGRLLAILVGWLVYLIIATWLQLGVNVLVLERYLSNPITLGAALRRATTLYGAYLSTALLEGLLLFLWTLALVVPAIYFAVCWLLVGAVVALEGRSGMDALNRSRSLVTGHWWRVFGLVACVVLFQVVVAAILETVVGSIPIVGLVTSTLTQGVSSAMVAVVMMVTYIDLRCRKEDFDLKLMATQLQKSTSAPPPAAAAEG